MRDQLWIKLPLESQDEETDTIKDKLADWWKSLEGDGIFYDVFLFEMDFATIVRASIQTSAKTPLVKAVKVKNFANYTSEYSHILFYSATKKDVVIYGNISRCNPLWNQSQNITIDDTSILCKQKPYCTLSSSLSAPDKSGSKQCDLCEMAYSKRNIEPIHTGNFLDSSWVTAYSSSDVIVEMGTPIVWRLEMAFSCYGNSAQIPNDILDSLATEKGRNLDDSSYNLCKLVSMFDSSFERSFITSEKFFMKTKLLKFHSRERDIILVCLANQIYLTLHFLTNSAPFNGKLVMDRFIASFPGKAKPQYGFLIPFEQLPSDIPSNVEIRQGYACISYMEMILWFFPRRVEIDIKYHASNGRISRISGAYDAYKLSLEKLNKTHTESDILEFYNNSSPLGQHRTLTTQLEKQIIQPLIDSLNSIKDGVKTRNYHASNVVQISFDASSLSLISEPMEAIQIRKLNSKASYAGSNKPLLCDDNGDLAQSVIDLMDSISEEEMIDLFPPCIQSLFSINHRHLYDAERTRLITFLFSIGFDRELTGTIWKQMCVRMSAKTKATETQSLEEFLTKNTYGKIVSSLWKSYQKSKDTSPDSQAMHYRCKSTISAIVTKTKLSVCPYANRSDQSDIEDLTKSCTSACSQNLSRIISDEYTLKKVQIYDPRKYFMIALQSSLSKQLNKQISQEVLST